MRPVLLFLFLLLPLTLVAGCDGSEPEAGTGADPGQADTTSAPDIGVCRNLRGSDVGKPANASAIVPCTEPHNSETFASGKLPGDVARTAYDDPSLDTWAYQTCGAAFRTHLGTNDSVMMRAILSWVWFRPSEKAWDDGARWYRCDVLGGDAGSGRYLDLPTTTKGLMARSTDDRWMTCADGPDPQKGTKVPCTKAHDWRAVTTIKVGEAGDTYPGDSAVAAKTKDFCATSVAAWLKYPADYDYGYTWFREREWNAGNRLSVCWAKTDK